MDGIQIYCLVIICINVICGIAFDGKPKTGEHKFVHTFIGLILAIPLYGRIFLGW